MVNHLVPKTIMSIQALIYYQSVWSVAYVLAVYWWVYMKDNEIVIYRQINGKTATPLKVLPNKNCHPHEIAIQINLPTKLN